MTKVMFILSSTYSGLQFWSINYVWVYENSQLKFFKNIQFLGKISNNWPNDLIKTII